MFDIGWSELLILGIVTLIFIGPKDLPVFLRTVGRFTSGLRKQAAEFRAQFDEAMRETEFDQIRKDVAGLRDEVHSSMNQAKRSVENEINTATREIDQATKPDTALPAPESDGTKSDEAAASAAPAPAIETPSPEAAASPEPATLEPKEESKRA